MIIKDKNVHVSHDKMKCQSFKFSGWHTCQLENVIASVNNGSRGDGLDVWLSL